MLVCWSVGGGSGTTVVVAGLASAVAAAGDDALAVDLCGDLPLAFGATDRPGLGLGEWLDAGADVPADALARLEVEVAAGVRVLPVGARVAGGNGVDAPGRADRAPHLVEALRADGRWVVVDAGLPAPGSVAAQLVVAADRSLVVVRACPFSVRRLEALTQPPTGVIVVSERRRAVTWRAVEAAAGAPVVAQLDVDPAVAAAIDAGLDRRPLPRSFLRVLGSLR